MAASVVGEDLAVLNKQPFARPSTKRVVSTKQVGMVVDQVKPGYSSKSEKRKLDPNWVEEVEVWPEALHAMFPIPRVAAVSLLVRRVNPARISL